MNLNKDTICAIATGTGGAGIGIVRISGPEAIDIADRLFRGKRKLSELRTYTAAYGQLIRSVSDQGEEEYLEASAYFDQLSRTDVVVAVSARPGFRTNPGSRA